ncbi:cTAGE family member 5 isoform X2 [Trichomycterus rosablanca]|uniref:cTAGE family member 5 isoform X2 n=1 Tax=Trichomycterus rosablanca TaxID=2290929 RepID=UPI002F35887D
MDSLHVFILAQIILSSLQPSLGLMSNYKICGDQACARMMSRVQALRDHRAPDCRFLTFKRGDMIDVYHKLARKQSDLWAGSIHKQFGYFPKDAVRMDEVYVDEKHEVEMVTQRADFFCMDAFSSVIDSDHDFEDSEDSEDQTDLESEELGNGDFDDPMIPKSAETNDAFEKDLSSQSTGQAKGRPGHGESSWMGSAVTGWFGEAENENKDQEKFRSRKLALDVEENRLHQEEQTQARGWIGDRLNNVLGYVKNTKDQEEPENKEDSTNTESQNSWLGGGISNVLGFGSDTKPEGDLQPSQDQDEKQEDSRPPVENDEVVIRNDDGWYGSIYNRITNLRGDTTGQNILDKPEDEDVVSKNEDAGQSSDPSQDSQREEDPHHHKDSGWYGSIYNGISSFYGDDKSPGSNKDGGGEASSTMDEALSPDEKQESTTLKVEPGLAETTKANVKLRDADDAGWYSVYNRINNLYGDATQGETSPTTNVESSQDEKLENASPKEGSKDHSSMPINGSVYDRITNLYGDTSGENDAPDKSRVIKDGGKDTSVIVESSEHENQGATSLKVEADDHQVENIGDKQNTRRVQEETNQDDSDKGDDGGKDPIGEDQAAEDEDDDEESNHGSEKSKDLQTEETETSATPSQSMESVEDLTDGPRSQLNSEVAGDKKIKTNHEFNAEPLTSDQGSDPSTDDNDVPEIVAKVSRSIENISDPRNSNVEDAENLEVHDDSRSPLQSEADGDKAEQGKDKISDAGKDVFVEHQIDHEENLNTDKISEAADQRPTSEGEPIDKPSKAEEVSVDEESRKSVEDLLFNRTNVIEQNFETSKKHGIKIPGSEGPHINQTESVNETEGVDVTQMKSPEKESAGVIHTESQEEKRADVTQTESGGEKEGAEVTQEASEEKKGGYVTLSEQGADESEVVSLASESPDFSHIESQKNRGVGVSQMDSQEAVDVAHMESPGEKEVTDVIPVESHDVKEGVEVTQMESHGEKEDVDVTHGEKEGVDVTQVDSHGENEGVDITQVDSSNEKEGVDTTSVESHGEKDVDVTHHGKEGVEVTQVESQRREVVDVTQIKSSGQKEGRDMTQTESEETERVDVTQVESQGEKEGVDGTHSEKKGVDGTQVESHDEKEVVDVTQEESHGLKEGVEVTQVKSRRREVVDVTQIKSAGLTEGRDMTQTESEEIEDPSQKKKCPGDGCADLHEDTRTSGDDAVEEKSKHGFSLKDLQSFNDPTSLKDQEESKTNGDMNPISEGKQSLDGNTTESVWRSEAESDRIIITEASVEHETSQHDEALRYYMVIIGEFTSDAFTYVVKMSGHMKDVVYEVMMSLPDDIRPGPDLYGMPWEAVIFTASLGLFTLLLFTCRFIQSVKSRLYACKERRMGQKVAELLEEKCKVLEMLSECKHKFEKLETEMQNGGLSAHAKEIKDLEVMSKEMKQSNEQMKNDLEQLQEQLDQQNQLRKQQTDQLAQLEETLKNLEREAKERKSQLEQDKTTLKVHEMNTERLQKKQQEATEENAMLLESKAQLLNESEGWTERLSELEEERRMSQRSHDGMMENCRSKDERIKSLTECLLKMKDWDSEEEGGVDDAGGAESANSADFRQKQKVQKLIYAAKMSADLKATEDDKSRVFAKLADEIKAEEDLQDGIKQMHQEKESLESESSTFSGEIQKLQQKLQIMTEMYQENELKLHRMLTVEEKERSQKEQQLDKAGKKISLAAEELNSYRQRAEELEEELDKTNQAYKNQVSSHEKKAHDNWLAARAADRDLADVKRENSVLRQRLTDWQFKLELMEKETYARDARLIRGERSPYGPSPLGRPPSETRPFLSPPTLMDGPSRVSPQFPMMPGGRGPDPGLVFRRPPSAPFLRGPPPPPDVYYGEKPDLSFGGNGAGGEQNDSRNSLHSMPAEMRPPPDLPPDLRMGPPPFPPMDPRDPRFPRRAFRPDFPFPPPPMGMRGPLPPPGVFPRMPLPPHMVFPPMRPLADHGSPEPPSRPSPPGSEQPAELPPAHDAI